MRSFGDVFSEAIFMYFQLTWRLSYRSKMVKTDDSLLDGFICYLCIILNAWTWSTWRWYACMRGIVYIWTDYPYYTYYIRSKLNCLWGLFKWLILNYFDFFFGMLHVLISSKAVAIFRRNIVHQQSGLFVVCKDSCDQSEKLYSLGPMVLTILRDICVFCSCEQQHIYTIYKLIGFRP